MLRDLKKILQVHRPQIVFLCETKLLSGQMNNVRIKLKFDNCFSVSRNGLGGGLAMLWNSNVDVNIASFSSHHIDAEVCNEKGKRWRCTGIYGNPEASQKRHTWTLLRRLAGLSVSP